MAVFKLNKNTLYLLGVCIALVILSAFWNLKLDLTQEKRYSLTAPTKNILSTLNEPIEIKLFLTGDLPADYKKLSIATEEILDEFRSLSGGTISYQVEKPGDGLPDSAKYMIYDSLANLGLVFERAELEEIADEKKVNQLIIPSALILKKGKKPIAIDLRSSQKIYKPYNVLTQSPEEDVEATRNAAEALLEFKFINAIDKLTRTYVPTVAYAVGNGEPIDLSVNDLGETLRNEYNLAVFDLKKGYPNPQQIDALLIVKPTQPFTEEDKLKLDQYIMHGGKIIWAIDKLYAELDSLMRSQADFVAYDRNLNLDDLLFKYGVRINGDLVQDLNCSKIPLVIGYNPDNSPRMQRYPWAYYPFLSSITDNPISKNLDKVLPIFPSSIDTVKTQDVRKTILLATDSSSRSLATPAIVSLKLLQAPTEAEFLSFNKGHVPVAVLLEGKFSSLYANRVDAVTKEAVAQNLGLPFLSKSNHPTKQIVIADADILTNAVSSTNGPLPMGMIPYENYRFANREFFMNAVDYLVSNNQLFIARNKSFTLRVLDKQKVVAQKFLWQCINVVLPIFIVLLIGWFTHWKRKKQFA